MHTTSNQLVRAIRGPTLSLLAFCLTLSAHGFHPGNSTPITRVEQEWKLVLNTPNGLVNAPQFHTVLSPLSNLDHEYNQVTWNYREIPNLDFGGLQSQVWNGGTIVSRKDFVRCQLSVTAETITWTQVMELNGNKLRFKIIDGTSSSWGAFGGNELMTSEKNVCFDDLNGYDTSVSVNDSLISYGSNRVDSLLITSVKLFSGTTLVSDDSQIKVVFSQPAP